MQDAFSNHRKTVYCKIKKKVKIIENKQKNIYFVAIACICEVKPRPFNITAALDSALSASIVSNSP